MQKIATITINIEKLQETSKGPFTLNFVDDLNSILDEGWEIEKWEILTKDKESEKVVILIVMNDDMLDLEDEAMNFFDMDNEFDLSEEDEEDGDFDTEDEDQEHDKGKGA